MPQAYRIQSGYPRAGHPERKSGIRYRMPLFLFSVFTGLAAYFVQVSTTVMPSSTTKLCRDSILPALLPLALS